MKIILENILDGTKDLLIQMSSYTKFVLRTHIISFAHFTLTLRFSCMMIVIKPAIVSQFYSRTFQRQIDTIIVFYTVFLLLVIVFLFLGAFIRSHQHTHFFCKVTVIFSAFHPFENVCKMRKM